MWEWFEPPKPPFEHIPGEILFVSYFYSCEIFKYETIRRAQHFDL